MANIIIPAVKSLTVTNKSPYKGIDESTITIGCNNKDNYYSYLFFDVSSLPSDIYISNAELVLFKTDNFFYNNQEKLSVSPLKDYFSTYTTYSNAPNYDHYLIINFYPLTSKVAVTVNITNIVSGWIKNRPSNKGIILYGRSKGTTVNFGSVKSNDAYLIPFLKVYYEKLNPNKYIESICKHNNSEDFHEDCINIRRKELEEILYKVCKDICCNNPSPPQPPSPSPPPDPGTIVDVNVTGSVEPYSIYNIIVEVEVTRNVTGEKDYYYVSDVYNNSLKADTLTIDKTYKIPAVPEIQSEDTQLVNIYGSYSGPVINY